MILTSESTTLTFNGTRFDDFMDMEQSSTRTAGGLTRTIRSGHRFKAIEGIRLTGTELKSLMDMLTDGSEEYYYTPTNIPDYLTSSDFPMSVNIGRPTKTRHAGGGTKKYYIELPIEGTSKL
jgi:hypothetical protein